MYQSFKGGLGGIALAKHGRSRAINAENPHGEKGRGGMAASHLGPSRKGSPCLRDIEPGATVTLAEMEGPGEINHIWITVDNKTTDADCFVLRDLVIRMYWDDEEYPSVESPLGDFFCCGFGRECIVNSVPMAVVPSRGFNCYFPMPFKKKAKITLENQHANKIPAFFYQVDYCLYDELPEDITYFHAQWKRERLTEKQKDYTILDGVKGKGHYVGTIHQAQGLRPGMTLFFEGDDSTYVDNKMRLHGTGSEDYYNGGWYALLDRWDRGNSLPLHGCLDYSLPMARTGGYRFFLADKMSYEKEIYHGMEHGEVKNNFPVDYTSVGFFYAAQPLQGREEPTAELRTVYQPTEHIYFPQLMQLSLGGGVQVTNERGIRMTTQHGGVVRIMLNDVPEGKYKVLINYFEKPNGADFQVWQRQKQLSGWISTKKDKEVSKDRVHVGDINLTEQTNSVTFHVRNNNGGDQFELGLIILERIKE